MFVFSSEAWMSGPCGTPLDEATPCDSRLVSRAVLHTWLLILQEFLLLPFWMQRENLTVLGCIWTLFSNAYKSYGYSWEILTQCFYSFFFWTIVCLLWLLLILGVFYVIWSYRMWKHCTYILLFPLLPLSFFCVFLFVVFLWDRVLLCTLG